MNIDKHFTITYYAKKHGKHITRNAKWDSLCIYWTSKTGNALITYFDLDATELAGKDQYRMATDKITPWSIK